MKRNAWGVALIPVGVAAVMTPMILLAAGGVGTGFDAVVHGIQSRYHGHVNRIPFLGLISCVAGAATHGGVRGLHVAEIENLQGPVDGAELNALVEQRVGQGWSRIVRDTTRVAGHDGSNQTLIYVKPDGDRMAMLVVDLDGNEMNVVQVAVDPNHIDDMDGLWHAHGKNHDDAADDSKQSDSD